MAKNEKRWCQHVWRGAPMAAIGTATGGHAPMEARRRGQQCRSGGTATGAAARTWQSGGTAMAPTARERRHRDGGGRLPMEKRRNGAWPRQGDGDGCVGAATGRVPRWSQQDGGVEARRRGRVCPRRSRHGCVAGLPHFNGGVDTAIHGDLSNQYGDPVYTIW